MPADDAATSPPERPLGRERAALVALAVSGAVILPGALNRFVFPKLAVAAAGVALAVTVAPRGRLSGPVRAVLALGSLLLVLAAAVGTTPLAQLVGRAPRYEGVLALAVYVGAGAAGARLLGPGRPRGSMAWFLDWLALASLLIALEAVLETVGLRPLSSNVSRPGSLLGNASEEGAWAVLALGPLASVGLRTREPLHIAGALAAAAIVVCSASRGALLGALVAAAVLLALLPRPRLRAVLVAAVAALVVAALLVPGTSSRITGSSPFAAETAHGRLILWGETVRLVAGNPALGVGPGGYVDAIPAYHDQHYERDVGPQNPPDSPHDWLLQAAAAGGLPLLLLALALAALTLVSGWRSVVRQPGGGESAAVGGMLAGLVGYGVALLFFFTGPGATPLAAVMGGVMVAVPVPAAAGGRWQASARSLACAGFAALTVVLAAAAVAEIPLRSGFDDAAAGHLSAADSQFRLARDLRPWDPAVDTEAAHAFAALAGVGAAGAGRLGQPWARRAVDATPDSVQALSDAAELALAAGRPAQAARLLATARRLDPANPQLRAAAARIPRAGAP